MQRLSLRELPWQCQGTEVFGWRSDRAAHGQAVVARICNRFTEVRIMLQSHTKQRLKVAALLGLAAITLADLAPSAAFAGQPANGEDIKGKTVYLQPGSRLRYQPNLLSRVYTQPRLALELVGRGPCKAFFCPVEHNKIDLFASRVALDVLKPTTAPIITDRSLRRGDEGNDVVIIQQALVKAGFNIKTDGKYGSGTEAAVRDFQKRQKVTADGVVGPQTRTLLNS
jgi:Putative peptidoglycan binding domain